MVLKPVQPQLSRALLDECVHCGFCLPACPTYLTDGQEMDSPRGRIYLMSMLEQGEITVDQTFTRHIDACLGCLSCVTACPSGVQYDVLLEATRPLVEQEAPRTRRDRAFRWLIFALFPRPRRLRAAALLGSAYRRLGLRTIARRAAVLRRLPARARAAEELLPPVRTRDLFTRLDRHTPAVGQRRLRVALLAGCAQRVFFGQVNAATIRVLAAEGCEVQVPAGQGCCGALSLHSGRRAEAQAYARRTIDTFEKYDVDALVVNVAGCGSALKEYGRLLADDPQYAERAERLARKVRDVTEVLAELLAESPSAAVRHPVPARVAYHDACHLAHAQQVRAQPRQLLSAIPGLELIDLPEADICCGSAGVYNLVQPETAEQLGRRKADQIRSTMLSTTLSTTPSTRPDLVATGNAGCLLQLRRYLDGGVRLVHPVEILDASLRGTAL